MASEKQTDSTKKDSIDIHNEIETKKVSKVVKPKRIRFDNQGFVITNDEDYLSYKESILHNC